jgi:hypothetical protein
MGLEEGEGGRVTKSLFAGLSYRAVSSALKPSCVNRG